jgi:hypothetical protein
MDIDWLKIREAVKRIDQQLAAAEKVIEETDVTRSWPEVTRKQLEAACPNWREELGHDWHRDFLDKRIGKLNYRIKPGSHKYRVAPEVLAELHIEVGPDRSPNNKEA